MGKTPPSVHHNAVALLIQHIGIRCAARDDTREKVGRIWTEFMLPFFSYPIFWVFDEARKSYQGKINNSVVQYAVGEQVMTAYGKGNPKLCRFGRRSPLSREASIWHWLLATICRTAQC